MDAVERFARHAADYEAWARGGEDAGHAAAVEGLRRIGTLVLAALELPRLSEDTGEEPPVGTVTDDEWQAVCAACSRLPVDTYGSVFDPLAIPPEEPVLGSLADDIADIYRDVVNGLRQYQAGHRTAAAWEWRFGFENHWGHHAADAMRALVAFITSSAPETE
jgi:hypothetical protein